MDNGLCEYSGCTDSGAENYDSTATIDDGSCTYPVVNCNDSNAVNYYPDSNGDEDCYYFPCEDACGDYYNQLQPSLMFWYTIYDCENWNQCYDMCTNNYQVFQANGGCGEGTAVDDGDDDVNNDLITDICDDYCGDGGWQDVPNATINEQISVDDGGALTSPISAFNDPSIGGVVGPAAFDPDPEPGDCESEIQCFYGCLTNAAQNQIMWCAPQGIEVDDEDSASVMKEQNNRIRVDREYKKTPQDKAKYRKLNPKLKRDFKAKIKDLIKAGKAKPVNNAVWEIIYVQTPIGGKNPVDLEYGECS